MTRAILTALLLLAVGCTKNTNPPSTGEPEPSPGETAPPPDTDAERPMLTRDECEAQGGQVVMDIGDGAIHRPEYTCESGAPPVGTIRPVDGEPIPTEGAVCCL